MHLTQHTDYALRALVALGSVEPRSLTAAEISESYGISVHHVLKVIQTLGRLGYVETTRGRGGGVRLAREPACIRLGELVRQVEPELGVVPCLRHDDEPCVIEPACGLKSLLRAATLNFLATLDEHTLADALRPRASLVRLLQLGRPA